MSRASHLKVIEYDGDTGELHEPDCADCLRRIDEIAGLERDIRGWAVRYAELKRDKATEAREHPMWPVGEVIFREWRTLCRHPRSPWTPDRFWSLEPYITGERYGKTLDDRIAMCRRAVAGAAFDAFTVRRANGTTKRFDEWERIFAEKSGKFEEMCNRAPKEWTP